MPEPVVGYPAAVPDQDRSPFVAFAETVEGLGALDAPARALAPAAHALLADPRRAALLRGEWLGHAVHPILTFLPVGAWTSALVLDALGGRGARPAAQRLIGIGILAAGPAAVTGLAEYGGLETRDRRTAVVHATANSVALAGFLRSWQARRRGQHLRGVGYALAAAGAAGVSGFLGGHLTEARKVSSRHPDFAE